MLILAVIFYGVTRATGGDFLAFVIYEAATLVFALAVYVTLAAGRRHRGAAAMAAALAVSLGAGAVQAADLGTVHCSGRSITTACSTWCSSPASCFSPSAFAISFNAHRRGLRDGYRLRGRHRGHSRPRSPRASARAPRPTAMNGRSGRKYPVSRTPPARSPCISPATCSTTSPLAGRAAGYVRDRDAEFADAGWPRAETVTEIERTRTVISSGLARVTPEELREDYPEPIAESHVRTEEYLVHLCTHVAYHLGQLDSHRRIVTGNAAGWARSVRPSSERPNGWRLTASAGRHRPAGQQSKSPPRTGCARS